MDRTCFAFRKRKKKRNDCFDQLKRRRTTATEKLNLDLNFNTNLPQVPALLTFAVASNTDVLNSKNAPQKHSAEDGLNSQWGQPAPQEFIEHCSP